VRREQQQQQAAVSALLLVAVLTGKNMRRLKTLGTARIFFLFRSESSYVSKEYSFANYNTLLHV